MRNHDGIAVDQQHSFHKTLYFIWNRFMNYMLTLTQTGDLVARGMLLLQLL